MGLLVGLLGAFTCDIVAVLVALHLAVLVAFIGLYTCLFLWPLCSGVY